MISLISSMVEQAHMSGHSYVICTSSHLFNFIYAGTTTWHNIDRLIVFQAVFIFIGHLDMNIGGGRMLKKLIWTLLTPTFNNNINKNNPFFI